jgi:hypothetical protein
MLPCAESGWVVAADIVGSAGSAEVAVEAPGLAGVPALDVVLAEASEPEVEGWSPVDCVTTVGAGWEESDGGVGAGEVVVGGGVLGVVVGGCAVAVG